MKKLATILLIAAFGTVALAHSGVKNGAVMKRMALMTSIAEQMKVVGTMAKGQATFDVEKARAALTDISHESARIPQLFKIRADDPKSEALPKIWEQFDTFTALANDTAKLSAQLATTVNSKADLPTVLKQMGASCKACHADFRQ